MGRRPNYGFEKRQRELKKQKKKEEKNERKRLAKEALVAEQNAALGLGPDGEPLAPDDGDDEFDDDEGPLEEEEAPPLT